MLDSIGSTLPFVALYAETHFRFFRRFPSLLYRSYPEVVFDAPARIGPGQDVLVTLAVNDIHRFPVRIDAVEIALSRPGERAKRFSFGLADNEVVHPLTKVMRAYAFAIPREEAGDGTLMLNCKTTVWRKNKRQVVLNDNLPTTSKAPLTCLAASSPLPASEHVSYGDLHVHSQYSQSHVEFGAPVTVIARCASASGLRFVGVTDHSYDLACDIDDYLRFDDRFERWRLFLQETASCAEDDAVVVAGEEVTCRNRRGQLVHVCGYGLHEFIPGAADGMRRGRNRRPTLTISEVIRRIRGQGGLAAAAHPGARPTRIRRALLGRGVWSTGDVDENMQAFQALNGLFDAMWRRGKLLWLNRLRQRARLPLIAGNDAHGDFNRYRFIAKPFVLVGEDMIRSFGVGRTGLYGPVHSQRDVLRLIAEGKTFVTTGPAVGLCRSESFGDSVIGEQLSGKQQPRLQAVVESGPETGAIVLLRVFAYAYGDRDERTVLDVSPADERFRLTAELEDAGIREGYLRAEAVCRCTNGRQTRAVSSPVYLV